MRYLCLSVVFVKNCDSPEFVCYNILTIYTEIKKTSDKGFHTFIYDENFLVRFSRTRLGDVCCFFISSIARKALLSLTRTGKFSFSGV